MYPVLTPGVLNSWVFTTNPPVLTNSIFYIPKFTGKSSIDLISHLSDYTTLNCCVQSVCHPWHHPLALRGGPESCSPWGWVCPGTPGSWTCQDSPGRDQEKVLVPRESLFGAPPPLCIPELHWRDWPLIWAPPPAIPCWSSLGTCRGALSPLNISPHDITSKTCRRTGPLFLGLQ